MFGHQKENRPFSGGLVIAFKRFLLNTRQKRIFFGLVGFSLFLFWILKLYHISESLKIKQQEIDERIEYLNELEAELEKKSNEIAALKTSVNGAKTDDETFSPIKEWADADETKRDAVKEAFLHTWKAYEKYSWGQDELRPMTKESNNWMQMGLTIVDSLDTIWIMGLKDEFDKATRWVEQSLTFKPSNDISLFETTIRILGGLASAYDLSNREIFLKKAIELADGLLVAFNTPTGIPMNSVNLLYGRASNPAWTGGASVLSEVGTLQLEFGWVSRHSRDPKYEKAARRVIDALQKAPGKVKEHLYPVYVDPNSGSFVRNHVTLGALGDSFYEYLLKLWLYMGKSRDAEQYKTMYLQTTQAVLDHLVTVSTPSQLLFIAEWTGQRYDKMDHLVCFAGAMFALGANQADLFPDTAEGKALQARHLETGERLTQTCYEMYHRTATGIAPELVHFQPGQDFVINPNDRHYLLRPETVESLFVLWRVTHNKKYREWGWEIFQNINRYCRLTEGFSGIRDVTTTSVVHDNLQQSFFMAETLKYLYLLFADDDTIPLDKYVFNTEAHPILIQAS